MWSEKYKNWHGKFKNGISVKLKFPLAADKSILMEPKLQNYLNYSQSVQWLCVSLQAAETILKSWKNALVGLFLP